MPLHEGIEQCMLHTSAAHKQAQEAGGAQEGSEPRDALAVGGELEEVEEEGFAPAPIFDRRFTKSELGAIRDNIPLQREPLYQPVRQSDVECS